MRKRFFTAIALLLCTSLIADSDVERAPPPRPEGYDSRDATVLSMMGWGVGICLGIAALCVLIDNNPGPPTD